MLSSIPVNKMAALHVSQKGCTFSTKLDIEDLLLIREKIQREQLILKNKLGIRNRVHWKNIKNRLNKWIKCKYEQDYPEEIMLLLNMGAEVRALDAQINEMKKKAHLRRHWNVVFGVVYERSLVFCHR